MRKILATTDFALNPLINAVLESLSAAPGTTKPGHAYYDTTLGTIQWRGASSWINPLDRASHTGTQAWSTITGTPTTRAGYGITDAQPLDADLTAIAGLAGNSGFLKKTAADTWALDTNSYLTGNQTVTVSGDATGSGATAIALTLANSGVTAGTYGNSATANQPFTVDAKGRITATGAAVTITPAWSSITSKPTTLAGYGITDALPSAGGTISGNLTITGNLTLNGTTTTVNSTVTTLDDPVLTLGGDTAPAADDGKDRGIEFRYFNGTAKVGFFGYDDSTGRMVFIPDATNTSEVFAGAVGTIEANLLGNVTGNVTGTAANITGIAAVANGGTGASTAAAARTNLGLAIGSNVQAWDADLDAIAALAGTTGFLKKTAANAWALDTAAYLTGNQTVTLTGDATGSGATSIAVTLANSGVTAGTYGNSATANQPFTVDAKGRITATGAAVTITPAWASVTGKPTTVAGYGISDFDTQVRTSRLDQMAAPTAAVSMGNQKLTNVAVPTVSTDAATKGYVDGVVGSSWTEGTGIKITGGVVSVDTAVVPRKVSATIGDATSLSYTITHNLGTLDIIASLREVSTGALCEADVVAATLNTAVVSFASAPAVNAFRVTIMG